MKKQLFFSLLFPLITFSQINEEFRAVKITNVDSDVMFTNRSIENGMDYMASIGINTILVVVWNGNGADGVYTLYPSEVMEEYFGPQAKIHPSSQWKNRDALQQVIINAHRSGMEVLPWFEMGFSTSYSQNGGHIIQKYPHWALQDINGNLVVENGFDWMSAVNPEVQDLIYELTMEIVDNYDIDGVEYSDRIPALPVRGGYDSVTVEIYKSEHNGQAPPADYMNSAWMRWRADKLNQFYKEVSDSIRARDVNLMVSSSPSLYAWSYDNYLQDSKTWIETGIIDNIIPQVYHPQTLSSYIFELTKALSYVPADKKNVFYSGMLIKSGSYVMPADRLLSFMQANRDYGVKGEAFFFYEGLRENNDQLGDTLKASFYSQPAIAPGRGGKIWRPKGIVVNEDDTQAVKTGPWSTENSINGFRNGILINTSAEYASLSYFFDVPFSGWFDVFIYMKTGPNAAKRASYTVYENGDSVLFEIDQSISSVKGFQPLTSVFLDAKYQKVLKLDNSYLENSQILTADAAMIMLNRRLSPDVTDTKIEQTARAKANLPNKAHLEQNYPNPFNPKTVISYQLPARSAGGSAFSEVELSIYNLLGQKVKTLVSKKQPAGHYKVEWDASSFAGGVYLLRLQTDKRYINTRKLVLIK